MIFFARILKGNFEVWRPFYSGMEPFPPTLLGDFGNGLIKLVNLKF